jgi:hypothetical protein
METQEHNRRSADREVVTSAFERHAQTIIAAVITALVLGVGSMVYSGRNETANLSVEFRYMAAQLTKLETKIDLMSNNYATKNELKELDNRFRNHELESGVVRKAAR